MRIVFCGTPQFAIPTLKHLLAQPDFEMVGVISQPDRPRGRGQVVSPSPVKTLALAAGLAVHQPEKIRSAEARELLRKLAPDSVVIIAYGQIIPAPLLSIPRLGWINLHASLLPRYRGAAPINWAIANGENETGVTTMRIDAGMDTGKILLQREISIGATETATDLSDRLAEAGAPLMEETLRGLIAGNISGSAQDDSKATYAPLLKREDGRIEWTRSAKEIFDRMRGFGPWPGAFTTFRGQTCHIWGEPASWQMGKETIERKIVVAPGTLLQEKEELHVVCGGTTVLRVLTVKAEGRKQVTAAEFVIGARLKAGERFGIT
jgi:methionyl-tRNA formyltransferase